MVAADGGSVLLLLLVLRAHHGCDVGTGCLRLPLLFWFGLTLLIPRVKTRERWELAIQI